MLAYNANIISHYKIIFVKKWGHQNQTDCCIKQTNKTLLVHYDFDSKL